MELRRGIYEQQTRAGINHKQNGVTSERVNEFTDVELRQALGIDPTFFTSSFFQASIQEPHSRLSSLSETSEAYLSSYPFCWGNAGGMGWVHSGERLEGLLHVNPLGCVDWKDIRKSL
jgi:hypothetical protein